MGHELYTSFATMLGQASGARDREGRLRHAAQDAPSRATSLRLKLRVYADAEHPHVAQQPTPLTFTDRDQVTWQPTTHAIGRRKEAVCRVYLTPGSGKWDRQRPHAGRLLPAPGARFGDPAAVHGHRHTRQLRRQGEPDRRRVDRTGRRPAPRRCPRLGRDRRRQPPQAPRPRLLTRDARAVERKKPGRPKARKRFQFSKR
jgi:small subunit ribosomal protein S9